MARRRTRTREAVARAGIAVLRERHRRGRALTERFPVAEEPTAGHRLPPRATYYSWGAGLFKAEAAAQGVMEGELYSRRRFAAAYTERDLDRLCRRRTPAGSL